MATKLAHLPKQPENERKPIAHMYRDLLHYWTKIHELFDLQQQRHPPTLVVFDAGEKPFGDQAVEAALNTLEVLPQASAEGYMQDLETGLVIPVRARPEAVGWDQRHTREQIEDFVTQTVSFRSDICWYDAKHHTIAINRSSSLFSDDSLKATTPEIRYGQVMCEETTHAVIQIQDEDLRVPLEHVVSKDLEGTALHYHAERSQDVEGYVRLDVNEFFPPITETELVPGEGTPEICTLFLKPAPSVRERRDKVQSLSWSEALARHIPQLAGYRMVERYHGNVKALLQDHPDLPELSPQALFGQYIKPLLLGTF